MHKDLLLIPADVEDPELSENRVSRRRPVYRKQDDVVSGTVSGPGQYGLGHRNFCVMQNDLGGRLDALVCGVAKGAVTVTVANGVGMHQLRRAQQQKHDNADRRNCGKSALPKAP